MVSEKGGKGTEPFIIKVGQPIRVMFSKDGSSKVVEIGDPIDDLFKTMGVGGMDTEKLYVKIRDLASGGDIGKAAQLLFRSLALRSSAEGRAPKREYVNNPTYERRGGLASMHKTILEAQRMGGPFMALGAQMDALEKDVIGGKYSKKRGNIQRGGFPDGREFQTGAFFYGDGSETGGNKILEVVHTFYNPRHRGMVAQSEIRIITPDGKRIDLSKLLPDGAILVPGSFINHTLKGRRFDMTRYHPLSGEAGHEKDSLHRSMGGGAGFTGYGTLRSPGAIAALLHEVAHAWNIAYDIDGGILMEEQINLTKKLALHILKMHKAGMSIEGAGYVHKDAPICHSDNVFVCHITEEPDMRVYIKAPDMVGTLRKREKEEISANVFAMKVVRFLRMDEVVNGGMSGGLGLDLEPTMDDTALLEYYKRALNSYATFSIGIAPGSGFVKR